MNMNLFAVTSLATLISMGQLQAADRPTLEWRAMQLEEVFLITYGIRVSVKPFRGLPTQAEVVGRFGPVGSVTIDENDYQFDYSFSIDDLPKANPKAHGSTDFAAADQMAVEIYLRKHFSMKDLWMGTDLPFAPVYNEGKEVGLVLKMEKNYSFVSTLLFKELPGTAPNSPHLTQDTTKMLESGLATKFRAKIKLEPDRSNARLARSFLNGRPIGTIETNDLGAIFSHNFQNPRP